MNMAIFLHMTVGVLSEVAKVVTYATEYGFALLEKVVTLPMSLEPSRGDRNCTLLSQATP